MDNRGTIFLPTVQNTVSPVQAVYNILREYPTQKRKRLVWDNCLATAANIRCQQIAQVFDHCFNKDCANRIVRRVCTLPKLYPENGNSLESIIGGVESPVKALNFLFASPLHAAHLLGLNDFFLKQNRIGVAFCQVIGSKYQYYYVILISE